MNRVDEVVRVLLSSSSLNLPCTASMAMKQGNSLLSEDTTGCPVHETIGAAAEIERPEHFECWRAFVGVAWPRVGRD